MNQSAAVQIVERVGDSYQLNANALTRILQQKNVVNKKVAILTVAGAFREGKSFFLSNCVRYLQCKTDGRDWMAPNASVSGFMYQQTDKPVTEGIFMWPEPFVVQNANGEEIAILIMDTEGLFDHKSSIGQCATVFALSALLSSLLVYNVMHDIKEDTLNHLQFFASYGSYALAEGENKSPFQSLLFLVRDWQNGNQFGMDAGKRILDDKLKLHANSDKSMQNLRDNISRSFTDIKCALLPGPGGKICRGSQGTITVADMDSDFKDELAMLIPCMVDKLTHPKEIGGQSISGAEFLKYFEMYIEIFASGKLPEPKSIFDATSEATHQSALSTSLADYGKSMKMKFSTLSEHKYFEKYDLQSIHQEAKNFAIKLFEDAKKMGRLPEYLEKLKQQIDDQLKDVHVKDNDNRIASKKIYDADVESTHQSALKIGLNYYKSTMTAEFSTLTIRQFFEESALHSLHQRAKSAAIKKFENAKKLGHHSKYLDALRLQIDEQFKDVHVKDNENRIASKKIYDATAESTHQHALTNSLDYYSSRMKEKFAQLTTYQYFEENELKAVHQEVMKEAVKVFTEERKTGNLPQYNKSLNQKIEALFNDTFKKDNKNRIERAEDLIDLQKEIDRLIKEQQTSTTTETDSEQENDNQGHVINATAALATYGGAVGATLGSAVPVVGTAVGGAAGAVLGGAVGFVLGLFS